MSEQAESELERVIHNGQILHDVPGVHTTTPTQSIPETGGLKSQVPKTVEDVEPEALAGLMAGVISQALDETPRPPPMEIVNRLLRLKTDRGHKVVWTRFDINQLFALWTNKLDNRLRR